MLGGSGANRTLTLTPVANQFGIALITVMVSDGVATANGLFLFTVTPSNDLPTISDVGDQATDEDAGIGPVSFTVGDVETPPGSLVVTAASDNLALFPNANLTLGGSNANRTIVLTPAANQFGTATITVTVSDGTATASDSFVVTVNPVDDLPTISDLGNQTTGEDVPAGPLAFTVGDAETPAGSLTVTAVSSNPALLPNANLVLGGGGANRTLTLTPAANQSGTATITVTVSDGALTASDAFVLTVTPAGDLPTISDIPDQTTDEDVAKGPLNFTVGDAETPVGSLIVTAVSSNPVLLPNANLVLGGSGANRTLTLTPAANLSGSATITVSVSDGSQTVSDTFVLTVTSTDDAPAISPIGDQTTDEGVATGPHSFTIGDVETDADSLIVTAVSGNPTLIPNGNLLLGGSGANRTLTVTPAAQRFGTATILVTVSDGGQTDTAAFELTVVALNEPPTISNIPDQMTGVGAVKGPLAFTIGDKETATHSLLVIAASDNQALIPDAALTLGGSGANRTLTLTPAAGQLGSATITVIVSDGEKISTDTFVLTVTPNNLPPTAVTLSNATTSLPENQSTAGGLHVADIGVTDDGQGANTLGLSGADASLFEIIGNALFLKSGVVLDHETNPTLDVTVTVDDAAVGATPDASATLVISVTNINAPPTVTLANPVTSLPENTDTTNRVKLADIVVTDDALGTNVLALTGADAALFEIFGGALFLKAGTVLDHETKPSLAGGVTVDDAAVGATPDATALLTLTVANVAPSVTVNQAAGQVDPTSELTIQFTVVFSEPVTGFAAGDVTLGGATGASTVVVTPEAGGRTYQLAVSGMNQTGTLTVTIGAGVAADGANTPNTASTSTDNAVSYVLPGWHNVADPPDVDGDGAIAAVDVLFIINYINNHPDETGLPSSGTSPPYYDVNHDGSITAVDALIVIDYINNGGNGEGEAAAPPVARGIGPVLPPPAAPWLARSAAPALQPVRAASASPAASRAPARIGVAHVARLPDLDTILDDIACDIAETWQAMEAVDPTA